MEDCIFCGIASGKVPTDKIFENDRVAAFNDINPKARIHILIIPKKHIQSIQYLEESDKDLMGELLLTAKKIAKDNNMAGYKLLFNVGREGGQLVDHVHMHLLSPEWDKSV